MKNKEYRKLKKIVKKEDGTFEFFVEKEDGTEDVLISNGGLIINNPSKLGDNSKFKPCVENFSISYVEGNPIIIESNELNKNKTNKND